MRRLSILVATAVSLFVATTGAQAATILTSTLTNSQEVPPATPLTLTTGAPRPISFGTADFVLNDAQTALTFTATINNIDVTGSQTVDPNDNLVAAHIHASATVTPATTAPVVWGFFGTPFNNNNPDDGVMIPFATGVGGVFSGTWDLPEGNNTTLAAQLPNILSNHSYINFHTVQFGGGEIRGTLQVSVPEPSVLALLGGAAVLLFGVGISRDGSRKAKRS